MRPTLKQLPLIFYLSFAAACGHSDHDPGDVQPLHGGQLLKGPGYFVEVVGVDEKVKVYVLQLSAQSGELKPLVLDENDLSAKYHFPRKPDRVLEDMPTDKTDLSINLKKNGDHYTGDIVTGEMEEIHLQLDVRYQGEKEKFKTSLKI